MRQVADNVWLLSGFPRHVINVYLAGEVLFDAATRWGTGRILKQLRGKTVRTVALTHCHPDHQGSVDAICSRFAASLCCHQADAGAMEGKCSFQPDYWFMPIGKVIMAGPNRKVDRILKEGDEVGGFRVVHAPGHTLGHVIYFRDSDGVAIAGDLLANINFRTGQTRLGLPPRFFCVDSALNRQSVNRLLELKPKVVLFGHGAPLTKVEKLADFVARMNHYQARKTGS